MRPWWVLLAACGAQPQLPPPVTPAPVTDADPPTYVPPPSDVASTGAPVGLQSAGAAEQARALAVRFLEVLVRGDGPALSRLLTAEVAVTRPGRRVLAARDDVIARALMSPRRRTLAPDEPVSTFVDLDSLQVQPLRELPGMDAADALRPDDWVVTFTFTPQGRRTMFLLVEGWRHRGAVIVRTGQPPQVVGL